jgi:hypothetical protein
MPHGWAKLDPPVGHCESSAWYLVPGIARDAPMGSTASFRLGAAAIMWLALSASAQARDEENGGWTRRSTWEPGTSLTFHRYFQPFSRVDSPRACRDRCVQDNRCTGWTYYDANFRDGGPYSYKLQRVCVLGAGLKDRQFGNRPGRTSGVVRPVGEDD